jgi:hypothetical protein
LARVFVSYARTDRRAVERVAQELQAAGHEAWIDVEDIQAGESWRRSIVRSIAQSDAVIVFLSPSSASSPQIATEVNLATESGTRIFPVKIGDAQLSEELRYDLAGLQFIDLTADRGDGTAALLRGLDSLQTNQGTSPPNPPGPRRTRATSTGRLWWVGLVATLVGIVILVGLVLRAAQDSTSAATTVAPTASDSSADDPEPLFAEPLFFEAEDGRIFEPMAMHTDPEASAQAYVSSPESSGPSDNLGGTASIEFDIQRAGTYVVWGRVASDATGLKFSDSFFVSLDGGPEDIWDFHDPAGGDPNWEWDIISLRCESDDGPGSGTLHFCDPWSIALTPGGHVLTFRNRESDSRLDALFVVEEGSPDQPPTLGQ